MSQHLTRTVSMQSQRIDELVNKIDGTITGDSIDEYLNELSNVAHILRTALEVEGEPANPGIDSTPLRSLYNER